MNRANASYSRSLTWRTFCSFHSTHNPRKDVIRPTGDSKLLNTPELPASQIKLSVLSYPFTIISKSGKTFVSLANASYKDQCGWLLSVSSGQEAVILGVSSSVLVPLHGQTGSCQCSEVSWQVLSHFCFTRPSFYRYRAMLAPGGVISLQSIILMLKKRS